MKDIISSYDMLVNLFERIQIFVQRLKTYTNCPLTTEMTVLLGKIMAQILSVLALSTKTMKERRISESINFMYCLFADWGTEKFVKRLAGRTDVEDALQHLDTLTKEEGLMTAARNLEVTHNVDDNVVAIKEVIHDIDSNVNIIKEVVGKIDSNVVAAKGLTQEIDNNLTTVKEVIHDVDTNLRATTEVTQDIDNNVTIIKEVIHHVDTNLRATTELTCQVADHTKLVETVVRHIDDNLEATKRGTHRHSLTPPAPTHPFPATYELQRLSLPRTTILFRPA